MTASAAWRTLLGDHPSTRALRDGRVSSPALRFDFADVAVPNKAFKRVVRDLEFDVAELALMTFLMARSRGVPLRMLPIVLFSRNPLRYLVCRAAARFGPEALAGRTVGVRAYTTTTAVWARALLADRCGMDLDSVRWLTYEEGHVAGVEEPPNVRRDSAHGDLPAMLLNGTADAVIVDPVPGNPDVVPVVADADGVWEDWKRETGADTVNHVVVVREPLASDSGCMAELLRLFRESGDTGAGTLRRSLEAAIAAAGAQRLLARQLAVDDLLIQG